MKFRAEDFKIVDHSQTYAQFMADTANARLDQWRKQWVRVYALENPLLVIDGKPSWSLSTHRFKDLPGYPGHTHQAYLVEIEPLQKKECAHEPRIDVLISKDYQQRTITDLCKHCGAKLKASWSVE